MDKLKHILWDTGANVSLIDQRSLQDWFPEIQIKDLCILIGHVEEFQVSWGNQNKLPFINWAEFKV